MRGDFVKRGGADFVSRASRTSPSPSASVDLAHLRPVRGRVGRATRNTSSEPEAEGELFSLNAGIVRSVSRRDVIRSTIYSGSTGLPDVAIKPVSKGRHHSPSRQSAMGPLSGFVSGSSTWSSRPPAFARQVARSHRDWVRFGSCLPSLGSDAARAGLLWWASIRCTVSIVLSIA